MIFLEEELIRDPRLSNEQVVERVLRGETPLFEVLIRRLNQRLYRIVRAILGDDAEVDDVLQETFVRLARDAALRQRLGQQGRRTVEERYSFRTRMHKVAAALDELLGR